MSGNPVSKSQNMQPHSTSSNNIQHMGAVPQFQHDRRVIHLISIIRRCLSILLPSDHYEEKAACRRRCFCPSVGFSSTFNRMNRDAYSASEEKLKTQCASMRAWMFFEEVYISMLFAWVFLFCLRFAPPCCKIEICGSFCTLIAAVSFFCFFHNISEHFKCRETILEGGVHLHFWGSAH